MKHEMRTVERDITKLQREEGKAMKEVKKLAGAQRTEAARLLMRQVLQTRKSVERLYNAKAQMQVSLFSIFEMGRSGKKGTQANKAVLALTGGHQLAMLTRL